MEYSPTNLSHTELILYLIREDLRCQKFFDGLLELGLDDAWYQPDLATLLLTQAGFNPESDAVNDHYYRLRASHCQNLQANNDNLTQHAMELYAELKEVKSLQSAANSPQ